MSARLFAFALLILTPLVANAREAWQIGHGPFLTASDVTAHNKFPQDMADIRALLAGDKPDWAAALSLFTYGKHFRAHSVARFADNYNGRLSAYLAAATKHYGNASFQNAFLFAAIGDTGRFARIPPAARIAALDAGMTALLINYARYELGEAERKAKAEKPNWSLENGAPKNWNEAFAFYYGPEGKHGAFEAIGALPNGEKLNAQILNALAKGQTDLVAQKWSPEAHAELVAALDASSIALFRNALIKVGDASETDLPAALARAQGYWLGAVDAVLRMDATRGPIIELALVSPSIAANRKTLAQLLDGLPGE